MHDHPLLTTDLGLPLWLAGLLKSFGALLFAPAVVPGILLALLVLRYSRILFLLGGGRILPRHAGPRPVARIAFRRRWPNRATSIST